MTHAQLDLLFAVALLVRDSEPGTGGNYDAINKRIKAVMEETRATLEKEQVRELTKRRLEQKKTEGYALGAAKMREVALAIVDDARDHEAENTNAARVIAAIYAAIKGFTLPVVDAS